MTAGCRVARTFEPQSILGNDDTDRRDPIKEKASGYGLLRASFFMLTEFACLLDCLNYFLGRG
jgi:hypothetical protein